MFERLPGHFQQQPLLRVHAPRLAGRDSKELRVELVHLIQEGAIAARDLAGRVGIGTIEGVNVPAVGGHLAHRIHPGAQQIPEGRRAVGTTWKPAAYSHDRDRLRVEQRDTVVLATHPLREQGQLHRRQG